jgi:mRNA interferase MazF
MTRGQVVEVDWPYTDLSGSKIRPAVVVQADFLNGLIDDTILVKITSKRFGIPGTEVELDPASDPVSGLSKICYASCNNILTRDETRVLGVIGLLSDSAMREIENCLKKVLALP